MAADLLIYIDSELKDNDLEIGQEFTPFLISDRLSSIKSIQRIFFSVPKSYQGKLSQDERTIIRDKHDSVSFWKDLFKKLRAETIIKVHGDAPFMDPTTINEMLNIHNKYMAEFTYSENLPEGLGAEILSADLIRQLPETQEETLPVSSVIKGNINQFDVELYYREPDIRNFRLSFKSSDKRNRHIMEQILTETSEIPSYTEIKSLIDSKPELLFAGPSYVELELTGACELDCVFCYRKTLEKEHGEMSPDIFEKILLEMNNFNLPYTLCLGGSGEPLMHSRFYDILEKAVSEPLINQIILETNALRADVSLLNTLQKDEYSKVKIIVNLNALDSETYKSLHGPDFFEKVKNNISILQSLNSEKERLYLQIMKINETEPFLDRFYDLWEKEKLPIILQKQNTFLGRIDDRRYSDLSLLERSFCWHLLRDLNILWDGTVAFCKQDVEGLMSQGSVRDRSLSDIWEQRKPLFIRDYKGDRLQKPDCFSCDEWYTFNF